MKLVWSPLARSDLREILDYIGDRNERAAQDLLETIEACTERLLNHPYIYRPGRVPGTREAVVHPNYIVIYRVDLDSVHIVDVIHARRQYPTGGDVQPS